MLHNLWGSGFLEASQRCRVRKPVPSVAAAAASGSFAQDDGSVRCDYPLGLVVAADEGVVGGADDVVALAGLGFEAWPVDHADAATSVVDQALALQVAGGDGDGGAAGTKHLGEELLSELEQVGLGAVAGGEQPARHAGFDRVKTVAEDGLRHLNHLHVEERVDELGEGSAFEELVADQRHADAEAGARPLHDDGVGALRVAEHAVDAGHAFSADDADFDGFAAGGEGIDGDKA